MKTRGVKREAWRTVKEKEKERNRKGGLHRGMEVLAARLVVEALFNLHCDFINISRPPETVNLLQRQHVYYNNNSRSSNKSSGSTQTMKSSELKEAASH